MDAIEEMTANNNVELIRRFDYSDIEASVLPGDGDTDINIDSINNGIIIELLKCSLH